MDATRAVQAETRLISSVSMSYSTRTGSGIFLRILAPFRVPQLHPLPLLDSHGSTKRQAGHDHQHFADGMCTQFPPGRGDCLSQYDESAIALQRPAHDDFLGAIEAFIEATHGHKGAAGTEQETTGGE